MPVAVFIAVVRLLAMNRIYNLRLAGSLVMLRREFPVDTLTMNSLSENLRIGH